MPYKTLDIPIGLVKSVEATFWANVEKSEDCWLWTGSQVAAGYGVLPIDGKLYFAHRLSYVLANGEIPHGMLVCHSCDNRLCVNPDHLWLGTQLENMRDKARKGRAGNTNPKFGEQHHFSKVTEDDVRAIRASNESQKVLAERFNISKSAVSAIKIRKTWKHL